MDELLKFYEHELSQFRTYAREFAERYPKTAGALHIGGSLSEDPHVERLVQSFALLAARIRMQLGADYSKFSESFSRKPVSPLSEAAAVVFDRPGIAAHRSGELFDDRLTSAWNSPSIATRQRCDVPVQHLL